jgi:hypothetical protein
MGIFTPAPAPTSSVIATGLSKRNPDVQNIAVSPVEITITIVQPTVKFMLKCRENKRLEIRTVSGGDWFTLWPGCVWTEDQAALAASQDFYVTSPNGSATVELKQWERV